MSTEAKVKSIVAEHLGVKEHKITDDADFIQELGADSLNTVEIVMALEEEFDIEIPDDDAETIRNFSDAMRVIESRLT